MKRALFSKKFVKNALMIAVIVLVAYYLLGGASEGFQGSGCSSDGSAVTCYLYSMNTNSAPVSIGPELLGGKSVGSYQLMVYKPALNQPGTDYAPVPSTRNIDNGQPVSVQFKAPQPGGADLVVHTHQWTRAVGGSERKMGSMGASDAPQGLKVANLNKSNLGILNETVKDTSKGGANFMLKLNLV